MNSVLIGYLLVFLGGGTGAMLRQGINRLSFATTNGYPMGTMFINISGSLLIGVLAAWFTCRGNDASHPLRLLLITGVLGGFTTFSGYSLDALLLWQRGETLQAALYVIGTVVLCLAAVTIGLLATRCLLVTH